MKICTGTLKGDTVVYNVNKDAEEKIGKVYVMRGKEVIEVPELKAGDIGAVAKLTVTGTGDTMQFVQLRSFTTNHRSPHHIHIWHTRQLIRAKMIRFLPH